MEGKINRKCWKIKKFYKVHIAKVEKFSKNLKKPKNVENLEKLSKILNKSKKVIKDCKCQKMLKNSKNFAIHVLKKSNNMPKILRIWKNIMKIEVPMFKNVENSILVY